MKIAFHCGYISLTENVLEREKNTLLIFFPRNSKARRAKADNVEAEVQLDERERGWYYN